MAPATWVGHCGVGASPRPRTPSPPDRGGARLGVRCDGFVLYILLLIYIKLYLINQYTPGKCPMGWERLTRPRGSGGVGDISCLRLSTGRARPDRASSREIIFTSPYAPVKGMPRKITHERSLGHRRSSQSEELTTNGRRPSEGRVRRPLNPRSRELTGDHLHFTRCPC